MGRDAAAGADVLLRGLPCRPRRLWRLLSPLRSTSTSLDLSLKELSVKDLPNPMAPRPSLTDQLKRKSRRRRDDLGRMAKATTPRILRNDLLPLLTISYVSLRELRPAKRKLRRLEARLRSFPQGKDVPELFYRLQASIPLRIKG